MCGLFSGFGSIIDDWLELDPCWGGTRPRYRHQGTLNRLSEQNRRLADGLDVVKSLYKRLEENHADNPGKASRENWRFEKRPGLGVKNPYPEVPLQRTIARITDDNWANDVPTASGLGPGRGSRDPIDLIHRAGTVFSIIELKIASNTALYAAFQVLKYGLAYVFSRVHAAKLGYKLAEKRLLDASAIHLRVLAPQTYYRPAECQWLRSLEKALNRAISEFVGASTRLQLDMDFGFEAFPATFDWEPHNHEDETMRMHVLWALHNRQSLWATQRTESAAAEQVLARHLIWICGGERVPVTVVRRGGKNTRVRLPNGTEQLVPNAELHCNQRF